VLDIGPTPIAYAPYVLIGTTLWQMFVDALQAPLRTVEQSRDMLIKINFPREALILSGLGLVGFNFLIRIVILVGTFLYFQIPVTPWILLAPLAMLMLVVLGTMVGLILTPLGILYKDVGQLLTISITFWLFLTPVVYPPPTDGPAAILSTLNPVSPLDDRRSLGTASRLRGSQYRHGAFPLHRLVTLPFGNAPRHRPPGWLIQLEQRIDTHERRFGNQG